MGDEDEIHNAAIRQAILVLWKRRGWLAGCAPRPVDAREEIPRLIEEMERLIRSRTSFGGP